MAKVDKTALELNLEEFRNRWDEMLPSELIIELKTLENEAKEHFKTLREKRAILNELRRYIEEVSDDAENMYDESQNN
jgi:hypothetical protein